MAENQTPAIDIEDEDILTSIFKDSFPESWQENPDFLQYLVELSSYGAERLSREPERLAEEKATVLSETQELAFHNYTTFIQTADCSKEIFQDFEIIEQHLGGLLGKLPEMAAQCNNVVDKAAEISASRRMNSLTLQRHTQLLEVLEMPQLMDTCVRNGYTEEALELGAHVKRLEKKHGNIPVIQSIVKEVKASTQLLLSQLVAQLRTPLQLPACLRVIGFLRRMDVFTEPELRITFLQARDAWFQSILEAIPKTDPYTHISKTIEASRVHLFDIMTQFRAIFSDEDPLLGGGRGPEPVQQGLIFHSWVLQKISQFLETLEADLVAGAGGRLDSVLGQCMYFGLSFSRVGADFRGLMAPVFERAALRYFTQALEDANKRFEENMQSYNLLGLTTTGGLPFGVAASQSGQLYPPTALIDFYPLAAYCNQVLSAFNDLRLCAPLTLAATVTSALQASLGQLGQVLLAFHRAEEATFNSKERDQFESLCAAHVTDLLPHLNKCLQALFPPAQLATALGIPTSQLNKKTDNMGQIDIPALLTPLKHLMPAAPEPEVAAVAGPVKFTIASDDEESEPTVNGEVHKEDKEPSVDSDSAKKTADNTKDDENAEHVSAIDSEKGEKALTEVEPTTKEEKEHFNDKEDKDGLDSTKPNDNSPLNIASDNISTDTRQDIDKSNNDHNSEIQTKVTEDASASETKEETKGENQATAHQESSGNNNMSSSEETNKEEGNDTKYEKAVSETHETPADQNTSSNQDDKQINETPSPSQDTDDQNQNHDTTTIPSENKQDNSEIQTKETGHTTASETQVANGDAVEEEGGEGDGGDGGWNDADGWNNDGWGNNDDDVVDLDNLDNLDAVTPDDDAAPAVDLDDLPDVEGPKVKKQD